MLPFEIIVLLKVISAISLMFWQKKAMGTVNWRTVAANAIVKDLTDTCDCFDSSDSCMLRRGYWDTIKNWDPFQLHEGEQWSNLIKQKWKKRLGLMWTSPTALELSCNEILFIIFLFLSYLVPYLDFYRRHLWRGE